AVLALQGVIPQNPAGSVTVLPPTEPNTPPGPAGTAICTQVGCCAVAVVHVAKIVVVDEETIRDEAFFDGVAPLSAASLDPTAFWARTSKVYGVSLFTVVTFSE